MTTTPEPEGYPHELVGDPAEAPVNPSPAEVAEQRAADVAAGRDLPTDAEGGQLAAAWRVAGSLLQLRAEANAVNPGRDKASDGTVGNAAHQATVSDHNPNAAGVVRALDLDVDGLDVAAAAEAIRLGALSGRLPQMTPGGYVILNRRITSPDFTRWNVYTGSNPHTAHMHTSCSTSAARYDVPTAWGVFAPTAPAPSPAAPASGGYTGPDLSGTGLQLRGDEGNNGQRVKALQAWLLRMYPAYARDGLGTAGADGWWGSKTSAVLREFAQRSGVRTADGLNIGPQIALKLSRAGFRG